MISVVYCTRFENKEHQEHLIKSSGLHKHIEVIEIINNGESLTKSYNRGLKQAKNDIVVFCHDDIIIETKQWGKKLEKLFNKNVEYGIIGVAGTKSLSETGRWWDDRSAMFGRVKHTHEGKSWLSSYSDDLGDKVEETILVDGVWFAVHKNRLKKDFDESVEGFHFYDVSFCFQNRIEGVKVGVTTKIRVNHMSIGQTNDQWEVNRKIFAEKYKEDLPVKINDTFEGRDIRVILADTNETKDLTNIIELCSNLRKMNCQTSIVSNYTPKDDIIVKRSKLKYYTIQEPPHFKMGDGKFMIQTPKGLIPSQKGTIYKVSASDSHVVYVRNGNLIDTFKKMYPECKFVDIHSDEYMKMDKTAENYKKLFINTFNNG